MRTAGGFLFEGGSGRADIRHDAWWVAATETAMTLTTQRILAALLPASGFLLCFGLAAQAQVPRNLPIDHPVYVHGVKVACTGVGDREQSEARWSDYPVKFEMVGGYGQWLAGEDITVTGRGENISLQCGGPWVVMDLEPGRYHATVDIPGARPKQVSFRAPNWGLRDVIVRFPSRMSGDQSSLGS